MKILAFSDLHGDGFVAAADLVDRHRPDWIVLAGDMVPDFTNLKEERRLKAQMSFWMERRSAFLREGIVTTYVLGNHELKGFRDPEMGGIPSSLTGRVLRLEGIPGDPGPFSFAKSWPEKDLVAEVEAQSRQVPDPAIYISHAPPYGSLDRTRRGDNIGHKQLFRHLQARGWARGLLLCGHVHQGFGHEQQNEMTVINLATGFALIEWREDRVDILEMRRLVKGGSFYDQPDIRS